VKRLCILVFVAAATLLGSTRAQTFSAYYGSQFVLSGNPVPLGPHFGLHLGAELEWNEWSLGVRASGSSLLFIFLWHGALDAYVGYTLESGLRVYSGGGAGYWVVILPGADGGSFPAWDWHGLAGVRFPSGVSLEVQPGVLTGERFDPRDGSSTITSTFWLSFRLGWTLRF
jgi:hypothetical protein